MCIRDSYRRVAFLSNPQDIGVIRLEADCAAAISLSIGLDSGANPGAVFVEGDSVTLSARAVEERHSDGKTGVSYGVRVKVIAASYTHLDVYKRQPPVGITIIALKKEIVNHSFSK